MKYVICYTAEKSTPTFETSSPRICLLGLIEHSELLLSEATESRAGEGEFSLCPNTFPPQLDFQTEMGPETTS